VLFFSDEDDEDDGEVEDDEAEDEGNEDEGMSFGEEVCAFFCAETSQQSSAVAGRFPTLSRMLSCIHLSLSENKSFS